MKLQRSRIKYAKKRYLCYSFEVVWKKQFMMEREYIVVILEQCEDNVKRKRLSSFGTS